MKIYQIIAKEMEKKLEERSFHFKQIEKYLKGRGFEIKHLWKSTYVITTLNSDRELFARFSKNEMFDVKSYSKDMTTYLSENREILFSDNTSYRHILLRYYKDYYIEYEEIVNVTLEKLADLFGKFYIHNESTRKLAFHFKSWKAVIENGGTSCPKEYADEWNKFMNTKWGEEVLEMTKDDLKTGMVVETRDGNKYMVIRGEFNTTNYGEQSLMFIRPDGFNNNDVYADDLIHTKYKDFDVVKIYAPPMKGFKDTLNDERNLIWERKSTREVCLEKEIEHLKAKLKEAEVELEKERGK